MSAPNRRAGVEGPLTAFPAAGFERFKVKARVYMREHRGELALRKIHPYWPITTTTSKSSNACFEKSAP